MKMTLRTFTIAAIAFCIATVGPQAPANAQPTIVGTWQGKLKAPSGQVVRRVLKIERDTDSALTATVFSPDETDDSLPVSTISLKGSNLTMALNVNKGEWRDYHRVYHAVLSADGNTLTGSWSVPGPNGPQFQMNFRRASAAAAWVIPPPPASRFITVEPNVKIELVDWGGTGKPIVFLAGLGNTAHVFSALGFARSFTRNHHVYGITRRGFGESSAPKPNSHNYSATRLSDDIVAVLDAAHIDRPVLLGHSIAGEELSAIGTRYPQKISGLVYLDAGYTYALYDPKAGAMERVEFDAEDVKADLTAEGNADGPTTEMAAAARLLNADIPRLQQSLRLRQTFDAAIAAPPPGAGGGSDPIVHAINTQQEKFTGPINAPILAIFASPHNWGPIFGTNTAKNAAALKAELADTTSQIEAFQRHLPTAKVIHIPNANHYVFESNSAEVTRDVNTFLDGLPERRQ